MTESAVKLLPLPDSPTTQVVLPGSIENDTLLTSLRLGALAGQIVRSSILRSSAIAPI